MEEDFDVAIPTMVDDEGKLPYYGSAGAAGADVRADIAEPVALEPGASACIPTGLYFEIPEGYEIQVRPRSGLAFKEQVTILNAPGTIDPDYRGELKVLLINHGKKTFNVEPKMRIAQLVVARSLRARYVPCETLAATERGTCGFGSTGLH